MCGWGGPTHRKGEAASGGGWGSAALLSTTASVWALKANLLSLPTATGDGRQICLVLEAFLLSSGKLELCLHPQAYLLTCQRWGNSFSPIHCVLEGVILSPDALAIWPGSYPHTKTSELILGLWPSFHLTTAPSDEWTIQRHSCHPAACPYGTTGSTRPAFYQWFKLIYLFVKFRCWEHPLPPHSAVVQLLLEECSRHLVVITASVRLTTALSGCCFPCPDQWAPYAKWKEH